MNRKEYEQLLVEMYDTKNKFPISVSDDINIISVLRLFLYKANYNIKILLSSYKFVDKLDKEIERVANRRIDVNILVTNETKCEFAIVDNRAFWYHDIERNVAFANFNKEKECNQLIRLFDELSR